MRKNFNNKTILLFHTLNQPKTWWKHAVLPLEGCILMELTLSIIQFFDLDSNSLGFAYNRPRINGNYLVHVIHKIFYITCKMYIWKNDRLKTPKTNFDSTHWKALVQKLSHPNIEMCGYTILFELYFIFY